MKDELGEVLSPDSFEKRMKTPETLEVLSPEEFVKQAVPTEEVYSPKDFAKQFSTPKEEVYTPEAFAKSLTPTKEGSFLSEGIKAVPGGLAASVEMYGRIGRTLNIPGADELVKLGKDLGAPFGPTSEKFIPSVVRSGIESKIQSIAAAIPGAIAGSIGGVGGAITGAALSGGTLFALAEWDQYLEDVENNAYANGATPEEAKVIRDSMKGRALVSSLAEGVPEAIADYIELRLLGLTAGTALRPNLKKAIVQGTIRYFGKILPVELGTELPTTAIQTYEREQAGIPTGPMGKNLLHTAGSVVVSTLLGAKGGTMLRAALQNKTTPATFRGYQEDPISGKKFGLYNLRKDIGEFKKGDTVTADWLKKNGVEVENDPADNVDEIVRTFEEAQKRVEDIPAFGSKEEALAYGATSVDENMVPLLQEDIRKTAEDKQAGIVKTVEEFFKEKVKSGYLSNTPKIVNTVVLSDYSIKTKPLDIIFSRINERLENKNIVFVNNLLGKDGVDFGGWFNVNFPNTIFISNEYTNDVKLKESMIVHESLHSLTADVLTNPITKEDEKFKKELYSLYNYSKSYNIGRDKLAYKNPSEFLSYAMTDKTFQKHLSKTPSISTNKSIWHDLIDAISKLLGLKSIDNSVLNDVLSSFNEYLESTQPGLEDIGIGTEYNQNISNKLAVLSGALKRNVHYDTERGLVIDEPTDDMYERIIRTLDTEPIKVDRKSIDRSVIPIDSEELAHGVLDTKDLDSISREGLRIGTQISGNKGQALDYPIVLVFDKKGTQSKPVEYRPGDRILTAGKPKIKAILFDSGDFPTTRSSEEVSKELNSVLEELDEKYRISPEAVGATLVTKNIPKDIDVKAKRLLRKAINLGKELDDSYEFGERSPEKVLDEIKKVFPDVPIYERIVDQDDYEKKSYKLIEPISSLSISEQKIAFARSQVDKSAWLKFFAGEGDSPDVPMHNLGEDLSSSILSDEKVNKETTDQDIRTKDTQPKHISWLARHLLSPEYTLRGMNAAKNSAAVIEGELALHSINTRYETWYKKLMHGLNKTEREQVRTAMELVYKTQDTGTSIAGTAYAKKQLVDLYTKYPRVQKAIDGVDKRGGIISLFEYTKNRYQNALTQIKLMRLSPEETQVFNGLRKDMNEENAVELVKSNLDIESTARKETDTKLGEGTWAGLNDAKKEKKRNSVVNREAKRMMKEVKEIEDIKKWGLRDYITNIELGSYRILDAEGNTLGFGRTSKEAKSKAFEIRSEMKAKGIDVGKLEVEASFSPINPTTKREEVLKGMKDIFEVLPKYVYAMEKRIIMQPIIEQYKQDVKKNPQDYPLSVKNIIQEQINYVMGAKYSWGDMIYDDIATRWGWKTGGYSKGLQKIRQLVTNLKLGYRPSSAIVNALTGFGNTWVGVGNRFFAAASKAIKNGTYTTSDGEVIDIKKKIADVDLQGGLGMDFSVGADGTINTRTSIWKPLGMFQLVERYVRPHSFMANYIYQRDHLGKNDFEATQAAKLNLRFQNFTYNLSALPATLRSPTSKFVGQFKSYLVKEMEFMSTLKGMQIPRMIGLQLMMAGPRGAIYLLRSLPILGALGLLNDWEKWLVKKKGLVADIATRGIGGVIGGDLSAPATFQLPGRPEDWGGPFIGDAVRLFKDVIIPAISAAGEGPNVAYIEDDFINWVASLSPLLYYWKDFEQSVMVWDDVKKGDFDQATHNLLQNIQKPNIWIRDSAGNKAYQVGGLQDRLLLLAGIPPVAKTQYQVLKRVWRQNEQVWRENSTKWYNKVSKKLLRGEEVSQDLWQDAILYGINPSSLPDAIKFKEMTPQERETMRANLFRKAEALQHFGIE